MIILIQSECSLSGGDSHSWGIGGLVDLEGYPRQMLGWGTPLIIENQLKLMEIPGMDIRKTKLN